MVPTLARFGEFFFGNAFSHQEVLGHGEQLFCRWKNYFQNLLNRLQEILLLPKYSWSRVAAFLIGWEVNLETSQMKDVLSRMKQSVLKEQRSADLQSDLQSAAQPLSASKPTPDTLNCPVDILSYRMSEEHAADYKSALRSGCNYFLLKKVFGLPIALVELN